MDALERLEPVARPLLMLIDSALASLGAPAEHEVWSLLRQVGATPADVVAGFAQLSPGGAPLRVVAAALDDQVREYGQASIPVEVPWAGGAGEAYADTARRLASYLDEGDESTAGRLRATASYVDDVASWQARSRDRIARALADVMSSAEAVTLRSTTTSVSASVSASASSSASGEAGPGVGGGAARVAAAADAGAHILAVAAAAIADGSDVHRAWTDRLAEVPYGRSPYEAAGRFDATIRLRH